MFTSYSFLLLLFLPFSVLVANPKRQKNTLLHGGQSRSWSAEQGGGGKFGSGLSPPAPTLLVQQREQKEQVARRASSDASSCLGATQVSVRLASVQDSFDVN